MGHRPMCVQNIFSNRAIIVIFCPTTRENKNLCHVVAGRPRFTIGCKMLANAVVCLRLVDCINTNLSRVWLVVSSIGVRPGSWRQNRCSLQDELAYLWVKGQFKYGGVALVSWSGAPRRSWTLRRPRGDRRIDTRAPLQADSRDTTRYHLHI